MTVISPLPAVASRPAAPEPARRDIAGVRIAVLDGAAAAARLARAIDEGGHVKLAFCNANLVNIAAREPDLPALLDGFLVLPDGIGVDLGSRLLHGAPFPENLNGTDFIPAFLRGQGRGLSVALIGARPGIAERAAARLAREHPRHRFRVVCHGFLAAPERAQALAALARAPADLVLVAMGNPVQERFIAAGLDARHGAVAAGVGALFDFLAGEVARAPASVRALRLEWLYRLWLEPGRLWRRYVLGNPAFLLRVLRARLRRSAA